MRLQGGEEEGGDVSRQVEVEEEKLLLRRWGAELEKSSGRNEAGEDPEGGGQEDKNEQVMSEEPQEGEMVRLSHSQRSIKSRFGPASPGWPQQLF